LRRAGVSISALFLALYTQLPGRSIVPYLTEIMYARRMVKQPIRLGLLVTLVVLALGACSGRGNSEQEEAKARPLPENNVTLHPGEYRSEEFEPSLSFRVDKGWENVAPELSDKLAISPG